MPFSLLNLYYSVTAGSAGRPGVKPTSSWLCVQCPDHYATTHVMRLNSRVGFLPWKKVFLPGQWKKKVKLAKFNI